MLKIELEQSGNTLLCRATQRGEELGRAEEKILFGTAQEFAQKQFASLSVLLVEHLDRKSVV